jgi:hypothetical protein
VEANDTFGLFNLGHVLLLRHVQIGPHHLPRLPPVTLVNPLVTDTGTIPAGTIVDSYFFAVNSFTLTTVNTSVTFTGPRNFLARLEVRAQIERGT